MTETGKTGASAWYWRSNGAVRGPFPAGLIRRYVILGRIGMDDELSRDLESWTRLAGLPELVPDIVREADHDAHAHERLLAARRWEDERGAAAMAIEEAGTSGASDDRRHPSGYTGRPSGAIGTALHLIEDARHRLLLMLAVAVVIVLAVTLLSVSGPVIDDAGGPDCRAPAQAGVDWENCAMEGRVFIGADLRGARMMNMTLIRTDLTGGQLAGADLSFGNLSMARLRKADLTGARLLGANLRASDLSGAVLERADLAFADLRHANLDGARLEGARFDHAIWVDGVECLPGSVGACLTPP